MSVKIIHPTTTTIRNISTFEQNWQRKQKVIVNARTTTYLYFILIILKWEYTLS